ncbi:MAG: hypothetical protein JRI46_10400 [Deltaproteobacteria bacterium]|nr:hypothetical protein [Deltaproteobacteria bacterium]
MDKDNLENEIKIELENIERLLNEAKGLIEKINNEPDFIETRAAGSILHDFYCGIEKIFERIAVGVDKSLPTGENWHAELLFQMGKPLKDVRGKVITSEIMSTLKEYMRFRHLFRHIYGFELKWERFKDLFLRIEDTFKELTSEIEKFLKKLQHGSSY